MQHHVEIAGAIAHVDDAILADPPPGTQLFHYGHFAIPGRQPDDGGNLTAP